MRKQALCLWIMAVALLPVTARSEDDSQVLRLDPMVITAEASASDIAFLRPMTDDAASLLRDTPGISLYGAGGVSSLPSLHGMADDRLNIQVDAMNLVAACPNHMNPALSYLDPSNVGSVTVYSNIVPVSVAGDSIGGTIQVNAPDPKFAPPGQDLWHQVSTGASYRSNGDARRGEIVMTVAGSNISFSYAGAIAEAGNYTAAAPLHVAGPAATGQEWLDANEVGSTRYKSENQDFGLALRRAGNLLRLNVTVQKIPYEGFPNQRMDMTGNNNTNVDLRYTGQFSWGSLEATGFTQITRHEMQFADDKLYWYGTVPGMPMDTDGRTAGATIQGSIILSQHDILRVGAEYQHYLLNDFWPPSGGMMMGPDTFININNGRRDRADAFGEWEAHWSPQWLSLVGVRSDTVTMNAGDVTGYSTTGMMAMQEVMDSTAFNSQTHHLVDHNWDSSALLRFTPDTTQVYEGGFEIQTRSPNLYERYAWSTSSMMMEMNNFLGDGNGYVGYLGLKPETAYTFSVSAGWNDTAKERWGLKVTPYYTYVTDYIDAERSPVGTGAYSLANSTTTDQFVLLQYVNDTARLYGVDVSGHLLVAKTAALGDITATGLIGYTRGENLSTGENLYNIMPLNGKIALVQQKMGWTATVETHLVAAKTQVSAVRNEMRTPGYGLLNLRASYQLSFVRLDLGVENALNKFYDLPLGGAYVGQGQTMSFNGTGSPWGAPVPGMGRTVYLSANVTF